MPGFSAFIRNVFSPKSGVPSADPDVFLSQVEKGELEPMLLAALTRYYDERGASALLEPKLAIVVDGTEFAIRSRPAQPGDFLACVDIDTLFTAQCALAVGLDSFALARDALAALATEATSAIAAQINSRVALAAKAMDNEAHRKVALSAAPGSLPAEAGMTNQEAIARSRAAVWHPCTQMQHLERFPLLPIARGEGAWLIDFDGKRYLDAVSSWWVNLFGHANPRINAALKLQLDQLEHVMLAGFTHEPAIELAERLAKRSGLGHAFFASDGACATEIALKMSFHFWKNCHQPNKIRFVSLQGSYHGETLGALSVTDVAIFRDAYAPLLRNNLLVPAPRPAVIRNAADGFPCCVECAVEAAAALEKLFAERHDEIAALIIEPLVQGAAGMRMYHPEYLRRARELCTRYDVHLIADEIMTGFGRTGTLFAFEQGGAIDEEPLRPDFLCLSKGLTGGYLPLSCVLSSDKIFGAFYDEDVTRGFLHSHSYTGNALACRAALATLDIFSEDNVIEENRAKALRFSTLATPLADHPGVRNFRHLGMIWAFDVPSHAADFSRRAHALALNHAVLLRPISTNTAHTVYFMPPYVIQDEEFALLVDAGLAIVNELGNL